jgi:hypothetical protein
VFDLVALDPWDSGRLAIPADHEPYSEGRRIAVHDNAGEAASRRIDGANERFEVRPRAVRRQYCLSGVRR